MLTTFDLEAKNLPSDPQVKAIADQFNGCVPLPMQFALCLRWLAIRQRHKAMSPRDRVNMTMTDAVDLIAVVRANFPKVDYASVTSLGRVFSLMDVGTARCGPSIHDLPSILIRAKVGALLNWTTSQRDNHPMAAYRSGGSLRGLGPETLSLYTADYGEFGPIKIDNIRSLPSDAICGIREPFVDCRAVLMQLSE